MRPIPSESSNVSLILVCHSHEMATGIAEVAAQVAGPRVTILPVGGAQNGGLGTDGRRVLQALLRTAGESGAVVLTDIGSSVLTARAAVAELSEAHRATIIIADGPLVEGAIAAAVSASTGASLAEVARAAEEARYVRKL